MAAGRNRPRGGGAGRTGAGRAGAGTLRVVAGHARGLRLAAPPGATTRPTADRVREATFNALHSLGAVEGARVLDAFAGSGALGIEALSRGADHATFVDVDPAARQVVVDNLASTGLSASATVRGGDVVALLAATPARSFDLVLCDPPYGTGQWGDLAPAVARVLADDGVAVFESDRELDLGDDLGVLRSRRYGGTVVTFASSTGDQP